MFAIREISLKMGIFHNKISRKIYFQFLNMVGQQLQLALWKSCLNQRKSTTLLYCSQKPQARTHMRTQSAFIMLLQWFYDTWSINQNDKQCQMLTTKCHYYYISCQSYDTQQDIDLQYCRFGEHFWNKFAHKFLVVFTIFFLLYSNMCIAPYSMRCCFLFILY